MKRKQQKTGDRKITGDERKIGDGRVNQEKDGQTKEKAINWKLVNRLTKLFVVALILFLCWNVLQSVFYVPISQVENRVKIRSNKSVGEANQMFADFTAGSWTFGAVDWNLRVYPETEEHGLLDPPSIQQRSANASFEDQEFIDLVKKMGAQPKEIGDGFLLWQSTSPSGISLVLFTRDSRVQAMRTRFPTANGVSIVEGRPKSETDENKTRMMPIADGISQVASRVDAKGRLTSAILKIDNEFTGDLRVLWKEQGWDVIPTKNFVSADSEFNAERYRCSKNDEWVEATFFLDDQSRPEQVILNRINTRSD